MALISIEYMALAACFLILYLALKREQWIVLLAASFVMYISLSDFGGAVYTVITIATVYSATRLMKKYPSHKREFLICALVINFIILAGVKYYLFGDLTLFVFGEVRSFAVPIGISFYTLQMTSYLLDCYWEVVEPEKNIFKVSLFCLYFPLLISGPICRYDKLAPQLFQRHSFDYRRISYGLIRAAYGVFEKLVVAERLSAGISDTSDAFILAKILLFPLQLYADFDVCMNIIIGISECFGIVPEENFKAPFYSRTMQEFWQRWHITLGAWLKNYIMYPVLKSERFIAIGNKLKALFGKKASRRITAWTAMLCVWICMGIWHGRGIKYVVGEGLWFWLIIVLEQAAEPFAKRIDKKCTSTLSKGIISTLRVIRTYLLYSIGMIFFNAPTLTESFRWIAAAATNFNAESLSNIGSALFSKGSDVILLAGLAAMAVVDWFRYKGECVRDLLHRRSYGVRLACYWLMLIMIILSLNLSGQEFLYSQF